MDSKTLVLIIIVIIIIGAFGGYKTKEVGYACDLGFDGKFCVWWHQTEIGEFQEFLGEVDQVMDFG